MPDASDDGLQAFESEPTAARADQPARGARRSQALIAVLATLVLVEAVPATLWVASRFGVGESPAPPQSEPPAIVPQHVLAAAPCEPVTSPEPPRTDATTAAHVPPPVVRPAAPPLVAGMMSVATPVPMLVYERGRLLGTTDAPTLMLAAGTHDLEFVNESVAYRLRRTVQIRAGQTAPIRLELPSGTLHVNAVPWAEVWLNNERIGETPIGNLKTRIGSHQVTFRHPELGERRATVLVTLTEPARISMDMRSK